MTLPLAGLQTRTWRCFAQPRAVSLETHLIQRRCVALGVPMSDRRLAWLDVTVVKPLVAGGVLSAADRVWLSGRMHADLAARINFADPLNAATDLSPVNSPTFTPNVGYALDGVTQYLSTQLTVQTNYSTTKFKQNDAHAWVRFADMPSGAWTVLGQSAGSTQIAITRNSSGNLSAGLSNGNVVFGALPAAGLAALSRRSGTHIKGFLDGAALSEQAEASVTLSGNRLLVWFRNSGGSVFAGRFEGGGMGSGLTDDQNALIDAVCDAAWAGAPPS